MRNELVALICGVGNTLPIVSDCVSEFANKIGGTFLSRILIDKSLELSAVAVCD